MDGIFRNNNTYNNINNNNNNNINVNLVGQYYKTHN
jgi:hypothetical protein